MPFEKAPRACRIVCTLGPASASPEVLEQMILAGMNVARLNFSHGTHDSHQRTVETLRAVSTRLGQPVAILQDLQGHKVRTGVLKDEAPIQLQTGQKIRVGPGETLSAERLGIDYAGVVQHVAVGHRLYIDDGAIALQVLTIEGEDLVCQVQAGGQLSSRKGVIFPDSDLDFPLLNEKDLVDVRFGIHLQVDMVAMSFVRSAMEILEMRLRLADWGVARPFLVPKIEDRKGIENLDEILCVSDAVLVARGDMGVTLPREQVPSIQKAMIRRANTMGVPVITATQMLESMMHYTTPTRAEVNDVYNAVLDGTDAVMLSGESASGRYPVLAVQEMDRICRAAEAVLEHNPLPIPGKEGPRRVLGPEGLRHQIATAAGNLAHGMQARCILGFSRSGRTLRALSAARCPVPVYGVVPEADILHQLLLHWGLSLTVMPYQEQLADLVDPVLHALRRDGIITGSDRVLVVASTVESNGEAHYLLKLYAPEGR
jgi:pyruvate kinase